MESVKILEQIKLWSKYKAEAAGAHYEQNVWDEGDKKRFFPNIIKKKKKCLFIKYEFK